MPSFLLPLPSLFREMSFYVTGMHVTRNREEREAVACHGGEATHPPDESAMRFLAASDNETGKTRSREKEACSEEGLGEGRIIMRYAASSTVTASLSFVSRRHKTGFLL